MSKVSLEPTSFTDLVEAIQEPLNVYLWPDGTWVFLEDYSEADYAHKSDDYQIVNINDPDQFAKLNHTTQDEILCEMVE